MSQWLVFFFTVAFTLIQRNCCYSKSSTSLKTSQKGKYELVSVSEIDDKTGEVLNIDGSAAPSATSVLHLVRLESDSFAFDLYLIYLGAST